MARRGLARAIRERRCAPTSRWTAALPRCSNTPTSFARILPGLLGALEASGIQRVALLSGDHAPIAREIAARVGIEEAYGDLMPEDKAQFIERMRAEGGVVMMIGDGINDAPALSTADVGVALAAHGGGIAAEAADIIVLVDSLSRVSETKRIADRTMRIARQSIRVGLGLSGIAMLVAAFGGLTPIVGAALQEVIDVAVILNALRTSVTPASERRRRAVAKDGAPPRRRGATRHVARLRRDRHPCWPRADVCAA